MTMKIFSHGYPSPGRMILRVLSMSLELDGYTVITANSGEAGIRRFEEEAPHFILTDLKMPGMDGLTVLKEIKKLNDGLFKDKKYDFAKK